MRINSNKNISNIRFKGYTRFTENVKSNNTMKECISESYLMRNLDTTFFARDYAIKTFPSGTTIAVPGCSQMECYTWATLLNNFNQDKKYKILGYDLVPEVIEDAKLAVLNIGFKIEERERKDGSKYPVRVPDNHEYFLINDNLYNLYKNNPLSQQQKEAKSLFEKCFEKIPETWKYFNIHHPRYKYKVKNIKHLDKNEDLDLLTKRLEYILMKDKRYINAGIDYIPKKDVFKDIIKFKVSDIFNIDKELQPESTGIVSFKNGPYHILGSKETSVYDNIDLKPAKTLFKKINSVLLNKGLYVLGTLQNDHLINPHAFSDKCTNAGQEEGKFIFSNSKIHNLLKETGFEPAFYDFAPMFITKNKDPIGVYLPSVWKKVKHI